MIVHRRRTRGLIVTFVKKDRLDAHLAYKVARAHADGSKKPIKTWSRRSTIMPDYRATIAAQRQAACAIQITENMIGHKLGDSPPRSSRSLRQKVTTEEKGDAPHFVICPALPQKGRLVVTRSRLSAERALEVLCVQQRRAANRSKDPGPRSTPSTTRFIAEVEGSSVRSTAAELKRTVRRAAARI